MIETSDILIGWCKVCEATQAMDRERGNCVCCGNPHVSVRRPEPCRLEAGERAAA